MVVLLLLLSCKDEGKSVKVSDAEIKESDTELVELFKLMQGSFNSESQAAANPAFFNISLHMYPIWKDRGYFLYVEQALDSVQERPYRQRIYHIERVNESRFSSSIPTRTSSTKRTS